MSTQNQDRPAGGDSMIGALLHERAGYLRVGKDDRAGQVAEQLRLRGYDTEGRKLDEHQAEVDEGQGDGEGQGDPAAGPSTPKSTPTDPPKPVGKRQTTRT
ncbi:hypothetical protein [Saccharothrix lopnurensis]|uniref:Uncharacterized protein n=1 Tax=Saccharothrix lopnurensis TaxID=1670621 RepID=A0ABW1PGH0_9PSEU